MQFLSQQESFNERERKTILQTKQNCEKIAAQKAAEVAAVHNQEMEELQKR